MPASTSPHLTLRAGPVALARLREHGYQPDLFTTLVGASGGPKWLVLSQLDRALATDFVGARETGLELLGSSIGSFRHACFAQSDPVGAIERFEDAYIEQAYDGRPARAEVTRQSREILDVLLGDAGASEIESHPQLHCNVVASRLRGVRREESPAFKLMLGSAAALNAASRAALGLVFERAVFSSRHAQPPHFPNFTTHRLPLQRDNVADALLASGSIPFVMEPVPDIAHAPPGLYLDGGIVDYHFDFGFSRGPGLVLFPHFFERITPGWFDKALAWRAPAPEALDHVVMISPSRRFIAGLPGGRVPDRGDFEALPTEARIAQWRAVVAACRPLADELHALMTGGGFVEALEPF